ncbi:mitochondrial escape protein 2 [Boothiomyces sp. JEL0866]|nr:mitochondrial escape protein 2 [Boothiomyces sp. JEL0866]
MEDPGIHRGVVWFDNVFPFKLAIFDPRSYFIKSYAEELISGKYQSLLPLKFPEGAEFKATKVEPNLKEGGLYLEFKYKGGTIEEAVDAIQKHVKENNVRSSFNFSRVNAFEVKGTPWVEDLVSRKPSTRLHVEFHGPDLTVESLFREFRGFGRIVDITLQPSSSKDLPRFASVEFLSKRSATSARNCIHGEVFDGTRLAIGYEKTPNAFQQFSHWAQSNIRISMLLLLVVVAGFTYVIFDPWRVFAIKNHITGNLDIRRYTKAAGKWFELFKSFVNQILNPDPIYQNIDVKPDASTEQWSERELQEKALGAHLKQDPDSFFLVSGPRGSGKTGFIQDALIGRRYKLIIRCDELVGKNDYQLLSNLCSQVHFFPAFGFLAQIGGFIDALVTATTGAKANISTTNEGEITKVLECVTLALEEITEKQKRARQILLKRFEDGGIDEEELKIIQSVEYPVVVIEDFLAKENIKGHHIYNRLAEWAAQIAEYRSAHVVFVSDNPAASRILGKVLPNKSIEHFHLSDASPEAALDYVKKRLGHDLLSEIKEPIQKLGGRLHDLDIFINKIQSGRNPSDAIADMVQRAVVDLRKLGHMEDFKDEKSGWTSIQFWKIAEILAKHPEASYDEVCFHPLFKGDPTALEQMERAGIITRVHQNGRPYTIKAGRPLFALAFTEMTADKRLKSTMGAITSKQLAADYTKKVQEFEKELETLATIVSGFNGSAWISDPVQSRRQWLLKMITLYSSKAQTYAEKELDYKAQLKLAE